MDISVLPLFGLVFVGSLASLVGSVLLAATSSFSAKLAVRLTAFASGVMIATSLLHLLPESLHELSGASVGMTLLGAIVFFFILEKFIWHHHHHEHEDHHQEKLTRTTGYLITVGDSVHNFIDGVLIASVFLVQPELGLLTALAIAAHEIPQEIADFSVMVAAGFSKRKALLFNVGSALAAFLGAGVTVVFSDQLLPVLPYLVTFAAGTFLYIALSDLIPELHTSEHGVIQKVQHIVLFLAGIAVIAGGLQLTSAQEAATHRALEAGYDHEHHDELEHADEDDDAHMEMEYLLEEHDQELHHHEDDHSE